MKKLSDTLMGHAKPAAHRDRLRDLENFGDNPGNLRARIHVPEGIADRPALVVVLHGCTQTAAGYDRGAGWSHLADEQGFLLLFPEQRRANNPNLCFNWFQPGDYGRGGGEVLSIRQMIDAMVDQYDADPARIFVTGLSAGGAMAAAMLATWPELFAGGAIMAGLPYATASNVSQAVERMHGQGLPDPAELAALVRHASPHQGRWPSISIWHGTADAIVHPANADAILTQWRSLHEVGATPDRIETVEGHSRRLWRDADGRDVIEVYAIAGMGHGTALATTGEDAGGAAGPFMLDAGISSTRRVARFWGLIGQEARASSHSDSGVQPEHAAAVPAIRTARLTQIPVAHRTEPTARGVGKVIEDALRAAGLMR